MNKKYYIIDASKSPLGRIATQAAVLLRGKNQPTFAAHINPNQVVIITNADSVYLTGTKEESKRYYRHSGYPGGIKETTFKELKEKDSTEIIKKAVRGMIPHNRLAAEIIKNLKVFKGNEHPFEKENIEVVNG